MTATAVDTVAPTPSFARCSPRERAVADLLVRGRTAPQIAAALAIGVQTVKNHRTAIYRKLGLAGGPGRPLPRIALCLLYREEELDTSRDDGYARGYRHGYVDGLAAGRRGDRRAAPALHGTQ